MSIGDQMFGIPVLTVQDVLGPQNIARVPLAPPEVAGSLNLRGRIVTAIDVRPRLGLATREGGKAAMSVVVEHENELYSLLVDSVGEVLSLNSRDYQRNPPTLSARARQPVTSATHTRNANAWNERTIVGSAAESPAQQAARRVNRA